MRKFATHPTIAQNPQHPAAGRTPKIQTTYNSQAGASDGINAESNGTEPLAQGGMHDLA
ncbi:MAG: hypothetical protein HN350_04475 [Phycisphaerales bacterium]|nr:hypothetical protein [Phycisphaerales bacterium]